jgi:23S rRNA (cytosine1962-C5)-methyltransferase
VDIKEIINQRLSESPVPLSEEGIPREPVRLFHGRGHEDQLLSKINIDFFPPLLFLTFYRDLTSPELSDLEAQLTALFPESPLLVQNRTIRPYSILLDKGNVPEEMVVQEGGLEFYLHPRRGQNPGFFTDMREGRRIVREIIMGFPSQANIKVLNLFAYTCAFSVTALAAGASRVVNMDMNRKSLEIGKRNHRLNHERIPQGYTDQALFLGHDIYKSFGRLKREGPYDLIIADPPPSQKGSFDLKKDYPRLLRRLPDMLQPGGELLLSLNSPDRNWENFEEMVRVNLSCNFQSERIPPPRDFMPLEEGSGLKLLRIFQIKEKG